MTRHVAVVTGATSGFGLATARALAQHGFHVIITGRDTTTSRQTAAALENDGLSVCAHPLDVTDPNSVARAFATIGHEHGRLDVLVNNAAIAIDRHRTATQPDIERVTATLDTNITGVWRCSAAAIPEMLRHQHGRIINITTHMATNERLARGGVTGSAAYVVSKSALNALTQVLADDLRGTGILVNAVTPGRVDTRMTYGKTTRPVDAATPDIVHLATLPGDGPTGALFYGGQRISW
ncbi:SDR family oxidoreductase [Myceligenerans halotolerans]